MDDLNGKKVKLAQLTKKEGGNLTVKDYTDEIYTRKDLTQSHFIEGKLKFEQVSEKFCNMLVVVPKNKMQVFKDDLRSVMKDFYENLDIVELKRIGDSAKHRFHEIKEQEKLLAEFVQKSGLGPCPDEKEIDQHK